jgi:hypothetical protein
MMIIPTCASSRVSKWIAISRKQITWQIAGALGIFSSLLLLMPLANAEVLATVEEEIDTLTQLTSVSQLSDVQQTDWAFQALQSLVKRYGCIAGYPDRTYRGNRTLTRFEFAAGLNACFERVNELIAQGLTDTVTREDLATLQRFQEDFATELASLRSRVDTLEVRTAELEANQFSTTTNLQGRIVFAANAGSFTGDRIIAPTGTEITQQQPNATGLYQLSLDLNTSFSGQDLLKLRLDTVSNFGSDNTAGFLEPYFGSVLEFSVRGTPNNQFGIGRLYYSFTPVEDFQVSIGSAISVTDYVDLNRYANGVPNFGTLALVNNYILFPVDLPSAGAAVEWNPEQGPFKLRAVYTAVDASNPNSSNQSASVPPLASLLYPNQDGNGGLFGNPHQAIVELEYSPSEDFALRLQYSGGNIFDGRFDVFGANLELRLSQQLALFGRYGYGSYDNTAFGDIKPIYWMVGLAFPDLFKQGALAGIAAGQPFIVSEVGSATQTNFEAFYNVPVSDKIQIAPLIQVVTNPGNQDDNGTIVTGTLRTVFFF